MVQHELLVALAAPLVVLGRPWVVLPWALPRPSRHGLWRAVRRIRFRVPWLAHDFAAWIAHAAALWLWHVPALFQATLRSDALHALQHLSFLGTALWFWQAVFHGRHRHAGYGAGVFYLFTTAVHTTVLGALITFAGRAWYSPPGQIAMRWNLTPLEDQQLGGLIMWVPAGLAYVIAALVLFAKWLRETDRPTPLPLASANPPATAP
jgi:cytochrome c oxidase assembly factor CtaG